MKKISLLLHLLVSLFWFTSSCNQNTSTDRKLSVEERMVKARAAKAAKKSAKEATSSAINPAVRESINEKATPADYKTPVDKVLKGPNGEEVHIGERGANYYINKNGNKTYLSSNQ